MTPVDPTATAAPAAPPRPDTAANIGEEFNSFIQLLTAQVRNQDPLSPLDSTQFVEQLATFSSLEQEVRANSNLETIATTLSDLQAIVASEWLGQSVTVESSWVPYTGEPVKFTIDPPDGTTNAVLTVRDTKGEIVWSEAIDPAATSHGWAGQTQSGTPLAGDQLLEFNIDLYQGATFTGSIAPGILTKVTDIATEDGKMRLGTASYLTADFENVRKAAPE